VDPYIARSFEAVTIAARRLRPRLRFSGTSIEGSVRVVNVTGAPSWLWRDLFDAIDHSDAARADAALQERPVTACAAARRRR
jgi:hypothetical protein